MWGLLATVAAVCIAAAMLKFKREKGMGPAWWGSMVGWEIKGDRGSGLGVKNGGLLDAAAEGLLGCWKFWMDGF
ncbi:hypothetical protein KY285_000232 [Solanum tuberosum]|nr:hypothetical protein KY284_000260 [Solanum tuberosum]KAH0764361.1 hypothetical protein KY285_000232 [Solanum tuberosum]